MNNKLKILCALIPVLILTACEKYTDITPKGKNLLNKVSDLDLLLNTQLTTGAFNFMSPSVLINDMYPLVTNVPNLVSGTVRDLNYIMVTYDESLDRAALSPADDAYDGAYANITRISNIVLSNADDASGDQVLARQLKAEAYVIRAYMHFLLVNRYARAYDPATAATDGGIPYVDRINFQDVNTKLTVKQVYDKMTADIDAAIALNALPDKPKNNMRVGKGFAYAVKARILLSMRDYSGALLGAETALGYNNVLEDHRVFLPTPAGSPKIEPVRNGLTAADNIFYAYNGKLWPSLFSPSLEILNNVYEPGNIIKDFTKAYDYTLGPLYSGLAGVPLFYSLGYQANTAGFTTSDMYLIKAESLIRTNRISDGMQTINDIRKLRVYPYVALTASTEAQAMLYLQRTARIENLYTWKNFVDLKRWNREGIYKVTVERTINNKKYTLSPESPLWIFPFPQSATQFNPSLTQNY